MNIPDVHLLVVGPQAPNLVPEMVTKIRHLPENKDTVGDKVYEAIEDAIASDTCTHVLMAAEAGGETSPVLTEANRRFVGSLVPNVVGVESRGKEPAAARNTLGPLHDLTKFFVVSTLLSTFSSAHTRYISRG